LTQAMQEYFMGEVTVEFVSFAHCFTFLVS